jgi:hypothetical protein
MIKTLDDILALRAVVPTDQCIDEINIERFSRLIDSGDWSRYESGGREYAVSAMERVLMEAFDRGALNSDPDKFQEALVLYFDYIWCDRGADLADDLEAEARNASAN